jgi:hypothetical protein
MIILRIINHTSSISYAEFFEAITAFSIQLNRDVSVEWDVPVKIIHESIKKEKKDKRSEVKMNTEKNQLVAEDLTLHSSSPIECTILLFENKKQGDDFVKSPDFTKSLCNSKRIEKIYIGPILDSGSKWTLTVSRIILNVVINPTHQYFLRGASDFCSVDIAEPCHTEGAAYNIGDVLVSDFVYRAWFSFYYVQLGKKYKYDHTDHIDKPYKILPGCSYQVYRDGVMKIIHNKEETPDEYTNNLINVRN